jgi:hypothetical protein
VVVRVAASCDSHWSTKAISWSTLATMRRLLAANCIYSLDFSIEISSSHARRAYVRSCSGTDRK